jgi:type VI secretion system protein ImpL
MKAFLRWLLSPAVIGTLGVLALSALLWWLGPLLGFADTRPLAGTWGRVGLLTLLWSLWIGRLVWVSLKRRRTNAALLKGISAGASASDREAQVLAKHFADATARLKTSGKRSWWAGLGGSEYVYELPWYIFVGAPGSGKTTALMNAGLQFLLGEQGGKAAIQGVGGTRNCDWWFTKDAVLIDTAGRYATQESDQDVDASAWDNFLALLKRTRPRQPINGVLLTINVQDLLQQGAAERQEHAAKLRARLNELQTKLGLRVPVYVLVTKADLIGGFNESFEALGKEDRDQVWGFTFPPEANSTEDPLRDFDRLHSELGQRLADQLLNRLEAERDVLRRAAIFAFPQEFAALKPLLSDFLKRVFSEGGAVEVAPQVRGVYFTSGTQEGSPIDRVMGSIGRAFGIEPRRASLTGAQGKSFFLRRLLHDVVFAERGLGIINLRAESRRRIWRGAGLAGLAVLSLAVLVGWAMSRSRNLGYAQEVVTRLPEIQRAVAGLPAPGGSDVAQLPSVLTQVQSAALSSSFDLADPPLLNGLGLYQGEKLDAGAQLAHQQLLEKSLAPRVAQRIEERLRAASKDDLENAYEALKYYLMLHSPDRFDPEELKPWIYDDWVANYQSSLAPEQLLALERHLDAMLALGPPRAVQAPDEALIASVRDMLVPFSTEYLAYRRIKRQHLNGTLPEFSVVRAGGPNAAQIFERASGASLTQGVPGFFSPDGYRNVMLPAVRTAVLQFSREEPWLRGTQATSSSLQNALPGSDLSNRVLRLYFEDYIKTWDAYLADVQLVRLAGLERSINVARIVSSTDSPLAAYIRAVAAETTLSPPPSSPSAADKIADKAKADLGRVTGTPVMTGPPLERMVDDHFANLRRQVEGQPAPIDDTLKLFDEIYVHLSAVDAAKNSKSPPPAGGVAERIKAAAVQLPEPVGVMLSELASAGADQSRNATISGLQDELKPVTDFCNRAVAGRYPFAAGARSDVPPEDFGRLFGVGGLMDSFFEQRLAELVDVSKSRWTYKPSSDGVQRTTPAALADFQRAARIREVFFRGGGSTPGVKLELRALELSDGLTDITVDIDGQVQKLAVGAPSIILTSPSPRNASQLKITNNLGATPLQFEGPWALFRMFDRFTVEPTAQPEKTIVVMNLDGRRARIEVTASSVFNPFRLREVQQFRCPSRL